jgi:hypothetical protein
MAIQALKEYKINFKELKDVCKSLNESGLAKEQIEVKVGIKGEAMLLAFLEAIDSIPTKKAEEVPEDVAAFYDALPQEVFDDAGAEEADARDAEEADVEPDEVEEEADVEPDEVEEEVEEAEEATDGVTSECPTFKTGWDPNEDDCKGCNSDYPNEYEACKAACEAAKAAPKAGKGKGKGKAKTTRKPKDPNAPAKTPKKPALKRTRYGHAPNTMSGYIDDVVFAGEKRSTIIKKLMKKFARDERKATTKLNAHIGYLKSMKGITINETEDGEIKAVEEYAAGYDENNTIAAV